MSSAAWQEIRVGMTKGGARLSWKAVAGSKNDCWASPIFFGPRTLGERGHPSGFLWTLLEQRLLNPKKKSVYPWNTDVRRARCRHQDRGYEDQEPGFAGSRRRTASRVKPRVPG